MAATLHPRAVLAPGQPHREGDPVPSGPASPRAGAAGASSPLHPFPTGLPARLKHSQARGMKGRWRSPGALVAAARSRRGANAADQSSPWGPRSSMEVTPALGVSGLGVRQPRAA